METLRKFGLKHHDFPTMMWNVAVLLRALALDVDGRNTTGISPLNYLFMLVTFVFYFYTYHLSTIWFVFWRADGDLLFYILLLSLSISSLIGVIKLLYMYVSSKKLRQIVADYLLCDAAIIPGSRLANNIKVTLRKVKRRAAIYWLIIIGNGVVYVVVPLLTPGRHITVDEQILWGLDPMFESPNYEIATTILWFAVFLTVYAPANITGFLIIIVGYSEAQMMALSEELLHLWDDAQNHCQRLPEDDNLPMEASSSSGTNFFARRSKDSIILSGPAFKENETTAPETSVQEKTINGFIKQRLVSIMKMHAVNINLIKRVENIFQNAMALEFTLLSGGLIAELLGGLENTYVEVPFALVQVAMDCITGQKLIDANAVFADAVYGCKWENFDLSNMKLALVMLQNAQKTMKLSAGGVNSLNYSTLMSVIKSIYSAYTALRSTMNT
uniref:Odorant receptor n=2 Tax=Planotortrix TaxID=65025 RepID=A0A0B5GQ12_9NEOP|nr:olfactory receptor OR38 [Planotortrix octo]